ncbi:phenylalanine--tRNA ligase subunit alpha [Dolosigranulum pigrum]|jgi:phenylalanine--tRNA ligase, alpha subunit|uniref:Phenylalanine--tRNA ligase alpha subunit n=1 Tax=Dolosigranulum pigrum TaxID=29394 RepID=A0A328KK69_9LACT|nr:phenylalanine--tRNA ligase subunit alpha [Dolosigranulum pigrum]QDO91620.1 phenylalanine--tRNA ligase subunit alpha [Dolosigranulum pigrum]QJS98469.1 phenylalanine--tRNA ligase subunit alpha [Dolosigranulum pigrum]QTJ33120.1 phenylalanine--tRNA ligase subunit alpha [Dolosigranulum pigrum]QTJ58683.1 phenylalanine--tRNA ligase subunit alpha [Dolosigranulum pigrum]RAN59374.1 phenylalanine--tRNA ligase subunit alpha [Dolosigranulum pigrum]
MTLKEQLQAIQQKAIERLEQAKETQAVEDIRIKYLGKKGNVTQVLKGMKDLSPEERPIVGKLANDVRDTIQAKISERKAVLHQEALNKQLAEETIDVTLPGTTHSVAQTHIILQVIEEIEDLFLGMGYKIVEGNEVETEHYNFERINVPKHHPARDMQDTFYIDESYLLRTQTSGTQPRTLEQHNFEEGPLKMISPGKVYRRDTDDATHSHQFHQIEGLVIDKDIAMTDLKGTLEEVAKAMFGDKHDIRLRPSYFPFTEPSVEVDVTCFKCQGSDEHCSVCKNTGWIEILGAGMVHPHVLEMSGVDPTVYGGFAFGLGPDRIAMLKHEIDDIRHFYTNDQRFLSQFKMKG